MATEKSAKGRQTLSYICEWANCGHKDAGEDLFYKHVTGHIPQLAVVTTEERREMFQCLWKKCDLLSDFSNEIVRHVKNHGYLALLKAKGVAAAAKRNLPICSYPEGGSNALQQWNTTLVCQWADCDDCSEFTGLRELIAHVLVHVEHSAASGPPFNCGWTGCTFSSLSKKGKLIDHAKVHTGERAVACPVCESTFANVTKFADHCIRQKPPIEDRFKCDFCLTYLPSERIFRDHVRQHINHYKCSYCDMTCHTPSVLVAHIRARHLSYKPFNCSSCDYSCKFASDLKNHLKIHTKKGSSYIKCNEKNCNFKCTRQAALMRHYYRDHGDGTNDAGGTFACHLCDKKYTRGTRLTKHLRKSHDIEKPPGYSRFIYRPDDDGFFRLRTVRLESLEIMESDCKDSPEDDMEEMVDEPETPSASKESKPTIIDIVDETGSVISCTYVDPAATVTDLPPDAKIVAVFGHSDVAYESV